MAGKSKVKLFDANAFFKHYKEDCVYFRHSSKLEQARIIKKGSGKVIKRNMSMFE